MLPEDDKVKMMKSRVEDQTVITTSPPPSSKSQMWEKIAELESRLSSLESDQSDMSQDLQKADWELRERVDRLEAVCEIQEVMLSVLMPTKFVTMDVMINCVKHEEGKSLINRNLSMLKRLG